MTKCPFCHFDNEDGALFCEQCKSDLGVPPATPVAQAEPVEDIPTAEPLQAEPYEGVPLAGVETMPYPAEPLEAQPLPAVPLAETLPEQAIPVEETHREEVKPATPAAPPAQATPTPVAAPPVGAVLPAGSQPRLLVLRGQKRNVEYPVYEGLNFIGRADEKPVDIDLEDQEPPDRIWCSRQHACLSFENNEIFLEDLNSANGTFVNRSRIYPGQKRQLAPNDIIQIGNVQLKVVV
jgi:FHA domain-containing protein